MWILFSLSSVELSSDQILTLRQPLSQNFDVFSLYFTKILTLRQPLSQNLDIFGSYQHYTARNFLLCANPSAKTSTSSPVMRLESRFSTANAEVGEASASLKAGISGELMPQLGTRTDWQYLILSDEENRLIQSDGLNFTHLILVLVNAYSLA
jgi:hypothetical protein